MSLQEQLVYYWPELVLSLEQTAIMMGISLSVALLVGLPLGMALYLTHPKVQQREHWAYWVFNALISIIRSFPFLLFVVVLIPVVRFLIGRASSSIVSVKYRSDCYFRAVSRASFA